MTGLSFCWNCPEKLLSVEVASEQRPRGSKGRRLPGRAPPTRQAVPKESSLILPGSARSLWHGLGHSLPVLGVHFLLDKQEGRLLRLPEGTSTMNPPAHRWREELHVGGACVGRPAGPPPSCATSGRLLNLSEVVSLSVKCLPLGIVKD